MALRFPPATFFDPSGVLRLGGSLALLGRSLTLAVLKDRPLAGARGSDGVALSLRPERAGEEDLAEQDGEEGYGCADGGGAEAGFEVDVFLEDAGGDELQFGGALGGGSFFGEFAELGFGLVEVGAG